mgnify:CR=1 FL=1
MKKILAFLLAVVLLLSLCACGKEKEAAGESVTPAAPTVSEPATQPEAPTPNDEPAQELEIQDETAAAREETSEEAPEGESEEASEETPEEASEEAPEETPEETPEELVDGLRPEFKEAMDSYEAFYTEYCSFLKKYQEDPSDLGLLSDYASMMTKASEVDENFRTWDQETMNDAELKYYLEVSGRVLQMIADVTATD